MQVLIDKNDKSKHHHIIMDHIIMDHVFSLNIEHWTMNIEMDLIP